MLARIFGRPEKFRMVSPFAPAECVTRLSAAADMKRSSFSFSAIFGSCPVIGQVSETSLRLRRRIHYSNSFQSHLVATLQAQPNGATLIVGEIGLHPFTRRFSQFWLAGIGFFGISTLVGLIADQCSKSPKWHPDMWYMPVFPLAMLAFGAGLTRFGRYLARDEAAFLFNFLTQTLEAKAAA